MIEGENEGSRQSYTTYTWLTWGKTEDEFSLSQPLNFGADINNACAAIYKAAVFGQTSSAFWRDYCTAKLKPLCMRGNNIMITDTRKRKLRKPKKNKNKENRKNKKNKGRKLLGLSKGRQLTDTGRPIEMCATVLPALLGACYFWPSLCSNNEAETSTEPSTDDLEDYEYDEYYDNNDEYYSNTDDEFFLT